MTDADLGVQALNGSCKGAPVPAAAGAAMAEVARRAAEGAVQKANGKRTEAWVRWAGGMLIVLLGAWWGLSAALNAKADEVEVEHEIESVERDVRANDQRIDAQAVQLGIIKTAISNVQTTVDKIEKKLE